MKNRIIRSVLILAYIGLCSTLALVNGISSDARPADSEILAHATK